jgi:adenylate kinase
MKNIVLFGKPGAGKGTQASVLKEKFELVHISTGDVFRYNISNQTELGTLAKSYMDKGELVPDSVTINMLSDEVGRSIAQAKGYIFDGFPRTTAQAKALDAFLSEKGMQVDATIALEADEDELTARLLERGKTSGRTDDTDETKIRTRFAEYNAKTAPLIDFYQKQNKLYSVNGIGEIDQITERIALIIASL